MRGTDLIAGGEEISLGFVHDFSLELESIIQ
jgi:hypothetical protein